MESKFILIAFLKEYAIEHKGLFAQVSITLAGISMGFLESIEIYVRLFGAAIGISVGVLTMWKLILDIRKKKAEAKEQQK